MKRSIINTRIGIKPIFISFLFTLNVYSQYNRLVIGDNNNGQIVTANMNGSGLDTIDLGGLYQSFYDAEVDPINKKIYMAWYYGIYVMDYDGSNFDTLVYYPSGGYSSGIAVDAVDGKIYWGSTPEDKIYVADLDGSNQYTVLNGPAYIGDVDIDIVNGHLYYGDYIFAATKGLYRCNLDGSVNTNIILGYDVAFVGLDVKNEVIYFADGANCRKIDYTGTNNNPLFAFQPGGFFVDTANSILYTSNISGNTVISSNLDGSGVQVLVSSSIDAPFGPILLCTNITNTINPIACDNYLSPSGNYLWTVSNTYLDTIPSSSGCDSVITVNLTILDCSGIESTMESNLTVFPNPTTGILNITSHSEIKNQSLKICNMLGEVVLTKSLNLGVDQNDLIDISSLMSGAYILKLGRYQKLIFKK